MDIFLQLLGIMRDEMIDQRRKILPSFSKGGDENGKDVQPIVEVFSELFLGDPREQVTIGCRDQADIDFHGGCSPDTHHLSPF